MQKQAVMLTQAEIELLIEALDSHEYRQLLEPSERNNGFPTIPDGEDEEIDAVRALISKLEGSRSTLTRQATESCRAIRSEPPLAVRFERFRGTA